MAPIGLWKAVTRILPALRGRKPDSAVLPPDPEEIVRRVQRLELRTRAFVDSLFSGEYASRFVGRGFEFSHVRAYEVGDDVRGIDWRVTARVGRPFVRRFIEERDLLVTLLVDVSASSEFSAGDRSVAEVSREVAAALAFAAARNNDRVSLLLATDRVEGAVPPGSGRRHVLRILGELVSQQPQGRETDLVPALDAVARSRTGRALVFVIGDFVSPRGLSEEFHRALAHAARSHDVVAVRISGVPSDELPNVGWVELTDPESGKRVLAPTAKRAIRDRFRQESAAARHAFESLLGELGVELLDLDADADPLEALSRFFRHRRGVGR